MSGAATPHGSYRAYYNRRLQGKGVDSDERYGLIEKVIKQLQVEKPALLDVGCNNGALVSFLASKLHLQHAVGIDIDKQLIARAESALRKRTAAGETGGGGKEGGGSKEHAGSTYFTPVSCRVVQGAPKGRQEDRREDERGFPRNVSFRCEDFSAAVAGETASEREGYDVVLCLSVTKWVHMHGGDEALCRLFKRMYGCLRRGGVLILEPQQNKSYKRARQKKLDGVNKTFRELKLQPSGFGEYLLSEEVGFERSEVLREVSDEKGKHFNRPVLAFFKGTSK